MTDEEKALIKEGKAADEIWPDEPAKASQKTGVTKAWAAMATAPWKCDFNSVMAGCA